MKKKNSRCFSCLPCISARTPSSPHAEPQTPPLGHAPGSLPINAPSVRTPKPNPCPVADNNVLEGGSESSNTKLQPVPFSSSVPSAAADSSSQLNPSPDAESQTPPSVHAPGPLPRNAPSVPSQTPPSVHAPGPLPSTAPSVPSSQFNPSPVADDNGLEGASESSNTILPPALSSSSSVPSTVAASSSQFNSSLVADNTVLEGVSSGSSNTILQPPPFSSSSVPSPDAASSSGPNPSPNGISSESSNTAAARHDDPQATLPGTSSGVTVQDDVNKIRDDIESGNLDTLIDYISHLLEAKKKGKESQKKRKQTTGYLWPTTSADFRQLKELLEGISSVKDITSSSTNTVIQDILNGIGKAHWAVTPLLVVANVLQRLETKSKNRVECLNLLTEMHELAKHIKDIKERSELNKKMEDTIKEGTRLIVEGSLMCCCQIDRNKFSRFFLVNVESDELVAFGKKIVSFHRNQTDKMDLIHYDAIAKVNERANEINVGVKEVLRKVNKGFTELKGHPPQPARALEFEYPDYAVGIEEPSRQVIKYLQWESGKKAYAVMLHGIGGMGKTTLANAVIALLAQDKKEYKYSRVSPKSTSDICELQKKILEDLMRGTQNETSNIRAIGDTAGAGMSCLTTPGDIQRDIGHILKDQVAFIYIDNALEKELLEQLFPERILKEAKKLRVLITARDENVIIGWKMEKKIYRMECLPNDKGLEFLEKEIYNKTGDIEGQITSTHLVAIVNKCCGIPLLLKVVAGFIHSADDKQRAYSIVMEDREKLAGDSFPDINKFIFCYDNLSPECKDSLLDICYFFKGWEWETVTNIMGESTLSMLERRALVSKDKSITSVHDIIFEIGKLKAKDTRFCITNATASEEELLKKMQDIEDSQMIKGLWLSNQSCNIPATQLDSMHKSLTVFAHQMVEGNCQRSFENLFFYEGEYSHIPFNWSGLKALRFLKYQPKDLNLLQEIPSENLKHIELDGSKCSDVSEISSSDIQQRRKLQVLRLTNFKQLKILPEEWGADVIKSLKEITLSHCESIEELTGSISKLTNLKILRLDHCYNLRRLPEDFGTLCSLEVLDLSHCYFIKELPQSISELQRLKVLNLNSCEIRRLQSLNSSLEELELSGCVDLKALPNSFGTALDSKSERLFRNKGVLSDLSESESDSDYESDTG